METTELIDAVRNGDHRTVAALIQAKVDINGNGEQGWTALNFAAGKGNLEVVQLLIENGADVFQVGRDRRTAYKIALAAGHIEVAQFLKTREKESQRSDPAPDPGRKYCRGYALGELRKFPSWTAGLTNGSRGGRVDNTHDATALGDEAIVFLHHDFTVCESIWPGEKVIFMTEHPSWREFCTTILGFKVPGDLDLISRATRPRFLSSSVDLA